MMWRIGGLVPALALLGAGTLPVPAGAQTACRQIQIATVRTAGPVTVTPLDAIAFPVPPAPATSTVVRQVLICPPGSPLLPAITPLPGVIGAPVLTAPIFAAPVVGTPVFETPVLETPAVVTEPIVTAPGAGPAPSRAAPIVVGAVPVDTVRDLATRGAAYDRMVVTVTGTATDVEPTVDGDGAPITAFRLEAQGTSVGVVVWGHPALRAGQPVRASGPFYVSTPFLAPSGQPWHNVIEADLLER